MSKLASSTSSENKVIQNNNTYLPKNNLGVKNVTSAQPNNSGVFLTFGFQGCKNVSLVTKVLCWGMSPLTLDQIKIGCQKQQCARGFQRLIFSLEQLAEHQFHYSSNFSSPRGASKKIAAIIGPAQRASEETYIHTRTIDVSMTT